MPEETCGGGIHDLNGVVQPTGHGDSRGPSSKPHTGTIVLYRTQFLVEAGVRPPQVPNASPTAACTSSDMYDGAATHQRVQAAQRPPEALPRADAWETVCDAPPPILENSFLSTSHACMAAWQNEGWRGRAHMSEPILIMSVGHCHRRQVLCRYVPPTKSAGMCSPQRSECPNTTLCSDQPSDIHA